MDAMLEALWALWAGDLDLPLEDSDLSLAFDRASFKMMGARDGRGGPGATEIGAAGNLGRAAAAQQAPNLKIVQVVMGVFVVLTHLVENAKMKPAH